MPKEGSLQAEVDEFVEEVFEGYTRQTHSKGKVIRDPIHGYHYLQPHEVEVLDSPIIQRLRYVHQTALAYLVYPSANHTRLEHSLGVCKIVGDIANAFSQGEQKDLFNSDTTDELRLAALLHDVGHGMFSHLSELLIDHHFFEDLNPLKRTPPYEGKSTGEILSHMIVTSPRMSQFLYEVFQQHDKNFNVKRIADYIIGITENPDLDMYKSDVITGPIDADKLDYIARDSYFTGIRSEIDVPHIIRTLTVWKGGGGVPRTLVVPLNGTHAVEQLHFAKLLLFPSIYHHQKVRALEATIRGLLESIWEDPDQIQTRILKFSRITDFLRITEAEFLYLASIEPKLEDKARRLKNRTLLKRALHISGSVLDESYKPTSRTRYGDLLKLHFEDPSAYLQNKEIRQEIFDNLPPSGRSAADVSDLWLDIPTSPQTSKDIKRCFVDTGEDSPEPLRNLFPIDLWLSSYAQNKWTGHVFYYPDDDHLSAANAAAIEVLESRFDLKFTSRATSECKL